MPQSYVSLHHHLVFSAKDRRPQIDAEIEDRLYAYIGGIVSNERGKLLSAGGMPDHIHLLVSIHQTTSIADLLRVLKANSSKWVHETFASHGAFAWQDGYGAFAVSYSQIEIVRRYLAGQKEHHKRMTFEEEFVALLKRHKIAFDERWIWQ